MSSVFIVYSCVVIQVTGAFCGRSAVIRGGEKNRLAFLINCFAFSIKSLNSSHAAIRITVTATVAEFLFVKKLFQLLCR